MLGKLLASSQFYYRRPVYINRGPALGLGIEFVLHFAL
jgi:hypothetical protein